jgi:phage regulator Rha-like protein
MAKVIKTLIIPEEKVISKIYFIRGQKIMLDKDLAELYGVETKVFNQAVRRNIERFPDDFMFQLTQEEWNSLRSQFVTLEKGRGKYSKYLPFVFTEQGVAMLSSILNSKTAIQINIQVIRVFTKMRELMSTHKDILLQLEKFEKKFSKYDEDIALVFEHLRQLFNPSQPPRRRIGFKQSDVEDQ